MTTGPIIVIASLLCVAAIVVMFERLLFKRDLPKKPTRSEELQMEEDMMRKLEQERARIHNDFERRRYEREKKLHEDHKRLSDEFIAGLMAQGVKEGEAMLRAYEVGLGPRVNLVRPPQYIEVI